MKKRVKGWLSILKESGAEFVGDNVFKLSASLAYYTVFSIGPALLVIISLTGLFFEKQVVTDKLYGQISNLIGANGANQIVNIIDNMQQQQQAAKFSIIGLAVLIFGATTVFTDMQYSINYIWSIKAKPEKGWLKFLKNRLLSFSLLVGISFLLIVTLFINTMADLLTARLEEIFISEAIILFKAVNLVILFFIVSFLFAVIYKVLPDAHIRWKDAFVGAWATGILFLIGKFLISFYLGNSDIANTYGAAASVIIILSWVYYTSLILYFGAEFTKAYALKKGGGIEPYSNAVFIIKREAKELPGSEGHGG